MNSKVRWKFGLHQYSVKTGYSTCIFKYLFSGDNDSSLCWEGFSPKRWEGWNLHHTSDHLFVGIKRCPSCFRFTIFVISFFDLRRWYHPNDLGYIGDIPFPLKDLLSRLILFFRYMMLTIYFIFSSSFS